MGAPKPATLQSSKSVQEVFDTVLKVVQDHGYTVKALSNEVHQMIFTSGKTAMSWGHTFVVGVVLRDGSSVVQLVTDGIPGRPTALLDGRKNKKAGEKLLEAIQAALDAGPAHPEPVESFAVTKDGTTIPWTSGDYPGA